jgi:hypothetical protein
MAWAPARPRGPAGKGGPAGVAKPPQTPPPGSAKRPGQPGSHQASASTLVVFSTAEKDELGIRTLVGEYKEEGTNHGRRFYKKTGKIKGHEEIDVYLYFWDERDGPSFSGWWFGNKVGGAQVWSRNQQKGQLPPTSGWTIPWDGEVKKELQVMNAAAKKEVERKHAQARMEARRAEENSRLGEAPEADWDTRVQQATERAADIELDVGEAIDRAKAVVEGDPDDAELQRAHKELTLQFKALAEVQRFIAQEELAAEQAPNVLKRELTALSARVRKLSASVKDELQRLKNNKIMKVKQAEMDERKEQAESREKELEGSHSKQLEEMLPVAMEKVDTADDEVEKVAIAAAPLQVETADDLRPVMLQAIKETEQRVRAATAAIGEARRFITAKLAQVTRFASSAKKAAVEEFNTLQKKLDETTEKLGPFKAVRQEYEQRVQAKKLYEELNGKLGS